MSGVTLSHALAMTPTIIRRAVTMWESYPIRMRNLEFVNAPFHVNVILDIFRSFMSKKMKDRITVRRGLPEFNSNDRLPGELGGNGESYDVLAKHWQNTLVKNYDFFMREQ
jgi:CRAL/TRIO domain